MDLYYQKMRKSYDLCTLTSHYSLSLFPVGHGHLIIATEELRKGGPASSD